MSYRRALLRKEKRTKEKLAKRKDVADKCECEYDTEESEE